MFEQKGRSLYLSLHQVGYYRLFSKGITDNGCWHYGCYLQRVIDIDAATGKDIYALEPVIMIDNGTVPASFETVRY